MHVAREGGGAGNGSVGVRLADGHVLVAGGYIAQTGQLSFDPPNYLAEAELYDPVAGTWHVTGPMSETRFGFAMAVLRDGTVLAAGGYGGGGLIRSSAELYDPRRGQWRKVSDLHSCRIFPTTSVLADGRVLVAGGIGCDRRPLESVERFDPLTGNWDTLAPMHQARWAHSATTLPDGRIVVAGGRTNTLAAADKFTGSTEIYDPGSGAWSEVGQMLVARAFHVTGLVQTSQGPRIVAAGGRCTGSGCEASDRTATTELFDVGATASNPQQALWTPGPSLRTARVFAASVVLSDGRLIVAGGDQSGSVEIYDPVLSRWSPTPSMGEIHDDGLLVVLGNGDLLVVGGFEGSPTGRYRDTAHAERFRAPKR